MKLDPKTLKLKLTPGQESMILKTAQLCTELAKRFSDDFPTALAAGDALLKMLPQPKAEPAKEPKK